MRTVIAMLLSLAFASASAQPRYDAPPPPRRAAENVNFAYADVLRVDPVYEYVQVNEPREECYDERVVTREPRGGDPTGGTILGAIIGGAIGNQVGSGSGRTAATAAGAVGGALIGNEVAKRRSENEVYRITVRLDNGSTAQYDYQQIGDLRIGDRVRVDGGQIYRV